MESNGKSNGMVKAEDGRAECSRARWTLLILAPILLFCMDLACTHGKCDVSSLWPPPLPWAPSAYVSMEALLLYACWMALQVLLFLLPVGELKHKVSAQGTPYKYRTNGSAGYFLLCAMIFLSIFTGHTRYLSKIIDHFLSLHVLSVLTAFVLSRQLTSGRSFFTGSSSNPTLWGWDLKRFLIRSALLSWVVITFAHQVAAHTALGHNSPFLIISIFHFFAVGESLWFEESSENSLLMKHDKVGAIFVYTCLTALPVLVTTSARHLSFVDEALSEAPLVIRFLISVPGYCLYRGAQADKSSFERNPNHPDFEELYVIREEGGHSVLADSYWGHCRNPSYLGAIILTWCLTGFGYDNIFLHSCFLTLSGVLVHRSITNDQLNSQIYGTRLWSAYQEKVKNRIFKFVF